MHTNAHVFSLYDTIQRNTFKFTFAVYQASRFDPKKKKKNSHLRPPFSVQQHVLRRQRPVNNTSLVQASQSFGHVGEHTPSPIRPRPRGCNIVLSLHLPRLGCHPPCLSAGATKKTSVTTPDNCTESWSIVAHQKRGILRGQQPAKTQKH